VFSVLPDDYPARQARKRIHSMRMILFQPIVNPQHGAAKFDLTLPTDRLENTHIVRSVRMPNLRLLQFTPFPRAEESE
jgi:hypothetical protein